LDLANDLLKGSLSINFTQLSVTAFVLIGGIVITWIAADEFQQKKDEIREFLEDYELEDLYLTVEAWFPEEKYM
jgi:small neutral amino acid transporter SnatA (MarC family)